MLHQSFAITYFTPKICLIHHKIIFSLDAPFRFLDIAFDRFFQNKLCKITHFLLNTTQKLSLLFVLLSGGKVHNTYCILFVFSSFPFATYKNLFSIRRDIEWLIELTSRNSVTKFDNFQSWSKLSTNVGKFLCF